MIDFVVDSHWEKAKQFCQNWQLDLNNEQNGHIFLAQNQNEIIGIALLKTLSNNIAELALLYVLPHFRAQKIGRKLTLLAMEFAREQHIQKLVLGENKNAQLTLKLLNELGFAPQTLIYKNAQKKLQWCVELNQWSPTETDNQNLFQLFDFNRAWAKQMQSADSAYFKKLSRLQNPNYLWIGCSDSRVPANQVVGLLPGELFVHRNVANVVAHSDLNALSVVQYAVDILKVKHIMVVGHLGCGGVAAVLKREKIGNWADQWLKHVQHVLNKHRTLIQQTPQEKQHDLLCQLNVLEQVMNVAQTCILKNAWQNKQNITLHGWIYDIQNGQIHDLGCTLRHNSNTKECYRVALSAIENCFLKI